MDTPRFNFTSNWNIPDYAERKGYVESCDYSNCDASFVLHCSLDHESKDPLKIYIKESQLWDAMKETVELELTNLQGGTNEIKSGTFTFTSNHEEFAIEFAHPPSFYQSFLDKTKSLLILVRFSTVEEEEGPAMPSGFADFWDIAENSNTTWTRTSYATSVGDNSKDKTGYVGLRNQGCTCYMNSMLQSLYHIPAFRKMVFSIQPSNNIEDEKNIPLNIQRLFCSMQLSDKAVSTKALTKSFGWDDEDAFEQHDVQEFCRVLLDKIEGKLKGSELEESIANLFKGKSRSFIRCKNVPYESSRESEFYDLQMVVKGCKDLEASFEKYTEKEELNGDNQYTTDDYGKQDAEMGVEFVQLPKLLHLHLNRFDFDYDYMQQVKINDKFKFPMTMDLKKYLAEDSKENPAEYSLCGVLVHSGSVYAGHYYAFLRTRVNDQWYEFNDSSVTQSTKEKAVDDNFGGKKCYSGYILVYVRKDAEQEIFTEVPDESIPQYLKEWFELYQKEEKQKEKQSNQIEVHVLNDNCVIANTKELKYGFENEKEQTIIHVDRTATIGDVLDQLDGKQVWKCNTWCIPEYLIQRRDTPITSFGWHVYLYARDYDESLANMNPTQNLVWVKFLFPDQGIRFIAPFVVNSGDKIANLFAPVNQAVGFDPSTALEAYVEGRNGPSILNSDNTWIGEQLGTGTVVILQQKPGKILPAPEKFVTVKPTDANPSDSCDEQSRDGVPVKHALENPKMEDMTVYDYFALNTEPLEILVYDFNSYEKPMFWLKFPCKAQWAQLKQYVAAAAGIKYDPVEDSVEFYEPSYDDNTIPATSAINTGWSGPELTFCKRKDKEYYPVYVNIIHGITEKQLKKTMILSMDISTAGHIVDKQQKIRIKKDSSIAEIRERLITENIIDGSHEWRFSENWKSSIYKTYNDTDKINYCTYPMRIDRVTDEEKKLASDEKLLFGLHCTVDRSWGTPSYDRFGHPFFVAVLRDETVKEVREKVFKNIGIEEDASITLSLGDWYRPEKDIKDQDDVPMLSLITGNADSLYLIWEKKNKKQAKYTYRKEKSIKIDN